MWGWRKDQLLKAYRTLHLGVINYAAQAWQSWLAPTQLDPEGKLASADPPPTAEMCLQTIRLLAGNLTVYADGSTTATTKDGGAEYS